MGVRKACFIALLLITMAAGSGSALATSPPSAERFSLDMRPQASPANTATSVGSIEGLASINNNGLIDVDESFIDTIEVDVIVVGIPESNPLRGYDYAINYPAEMLSINYHEAKLGVVNPGSSPNVTADPLPDTDGTFFVHFDDTGGPGTEESGTGVLGTVRIEAIATYTGELPLVLTIASHTDPSGEHHAADAIDSGGICLNQPCDSDGDGWTDVEEAGMPLCGDGRNEDAVVGGLASDDGLVDDGCPGGPAVSGLYSEAQFNIGTDPNDPCGFDGWPPDFASGGIPDSTNRLTITDVTSFLSPLRKFNTSPGDAAFNQRWDIHPGRQVFNYWINIADITRLISVTPPMFGGVRAFNGPTCS